MEESNAIDNHLTFDEFYNSIYFRIPKTLLISVGLWPYHRHKIIIRIIWLVLCFIVPAPQVIGVLINYREIGRLMEHIVLIIVPYVMFTKLFTLAIAGKECEIVYEGIVDNWNMIIDHDEKQLLRKYQERGRLINILYLSMQSSVYVAFLFLPLIPVILNIISPLESPRSFVYVLHGEFLMKNKDDYYAFIYLWDTTAVTCVLAIGAPVDSMYAASVEHLLGLFAIMEYRLQKLTNVPSNNSTETKDTSYDYMIAIIKLHQRALHFTNTIEQQYSLCFLILIIAQIILFPLICNLLLISWGSFIDSCRYGMFAACIIVHLFNMMWPGQKLISISERIFKAAYYNEWYNCSIQTKRILRIFMARCIRPAIITGGRLTVLNFVNFFMIVRTAASYVTVFASFRASD